MNETLIKIENVSKKFCRSLKKSLWYGVKDLGSELMGQSHEEKRGLRTDEFWAINDVSFELKRGECLGLIGSNGAGKTTLLRMLNGLMKPDKGKIEMRGRVGAIIALGAGFNPILTGRENIYINASILGIKKKEVDTKFGKIVEFAGLNDFIDAPVQSYSSGMQVRLGFSIATASNPDILLLDEVLAVGDVGFRAKCFEKMKEFKNENKIIVFVSHDLNQIRKFCPTTLWLSDGKIKMFGKTTDVTNAYIEMSNHRTLKQSKGQDFKKFGTFDAEITSVQVLDEKNEQTDSIDICSDVTFKIEYIAHKPIELPNFGIGIFTADGIRVTNTCTSAQECSPKLIYGSGVIYCKYKRLPLMPGRYKITVAIKDNPGFIVYDRNEDIAGFQVRQRDAWREESENMGILYKLATWKHENSN